MDKDNAIKFSRKCDCGYNWQVAYLNNFYYIK